METSYTEKIAELEKKNQENKLEKAKLEEKLKIINEDLKKIIEKIEEHGVKPETLEEETNKLKDEIDVKIKDIEEILA